MRKKIFLLLFLLLVAAAAPVARIAQPYLKERLPDTFTLQKVAMDIESGYPDLLPPDPDFFKNQLFHYIGHGVETVTFADEEGRFVLKFFLQKSMQGERRYPVPNPAHLWPPHRKRSIERRAAIYRKALFKTLRNYHVAWEKMREKTALVALHLNATQGQLGAIPLIDGQGQEHLIDLDRACFVVQKKATPFEQKLASCKSPEEAQRALTALQEYLNARAKLGFVDRETELKLDTNYGFIGEEPVGFDLGKLEYKEGFSDKEVSRMNDLLQRWAEQHDLPRPFYDSSILRGERASP